MKFTGALLTGLLILGSLAGCAKPAPAPAPEVAQPSVIYPEKPGQEVIVTSISLATFHQGEGSWFVFILKNQGSRPYKNVEVYCYSVKNKYDEEWSEPDGDWSNSARLAIGDSGEVTVPVRTYVGQRLGEYTLKYYLRFTDEDGGEFRTRTYYQTVNVVAANEDIIVTSISPTTFHQGEGSWFVFILKNQGLRPYKNVEVYCYSVKNKYDEEWSEPDDDWSNSASLAVDDSGEVTVPVRTYIGPQPGEYTLKYHLRFTDEDGREFRTPTYHQTVNVVAANEDIIVTSISPATLYQDQESWFHFILKNQGSRPYENVEVYCCSVKNEDDEEWPEPDDDWSNSASLAVDDSGAVVVPLRTSVGQRPGKYTLKYYLRFTDEDGREFRTPTYYQTVYVVEPIEVEDII